MNLAVVTETYPPEINGVAATVERVVHGLRQRGHDMALVRPGHEGVPSWPVPRYPGLRMGRPCAGLLRRQWQLKRPDHVHIATEGPLGWSALRAARALGLPVTADFRTNFHSYTRHYGAAWLAAPALAYLRWFHNHCGATMVPTETLRRELSEAGFQRLHVVARGVDTERFSPERRNVALRRHWGAGEDTPVWLFVGRMAPEKNLGLLLRAWQGARQQRPDLRLVLVGDGPEREALQAAHPKAHFSGAQQGLALAEHYASADAFIFPSLSETFGNVVLEALASGLPVLAFDCAAAATVIEPPANGWLVPPGDEAAFVEAALQALAMKAEQRVAARQTALQQGWPRIVQQAEQLMRAVASLTIGTALQASSTAAPARGRNDELPAGPA